MQDKNTLLKGLPKVDLLLEDSRIQSLNNVSRVIIVDGIRETLEMVRKGILSDRTESVDYDSIVDQVIECIDNKNRMHLRRVVNATGTIFHTNLGRAILPKSSIDAVIEVSSRYCNLEYDIENSERGSRYNHVEELLCRITGAEAAMVVNNNAAAVMLALSTLSAGKEAIVSRGQLVEIGGSFRVPAVMELSTAILSEVGTTNRTHLSDYENAINEDTGVILKVHQSNFKILGFTEEVDAEELAALGRKHGIPVIEDIGSGVLIDVSKYGLTYEPTIQRSIKKGVDVVTFSGDKLLGGPQAGIIVGKKEYIQRMKKNQLTRALRIDKMTIAALEALLRIYIDEERAVQEIPGINMMVRDLKDIKKDAQKLARMIRTRAGNSLSVSVHPDFSQIGGGAMPIERLDTFAVAVRSEAISTEELERGLRFNKVPIIGRIFKDRVLFDVRTLFSEDYRIIAEALEKLCRS